ncbi:ABC transporter permease subunit (plasmid) [Pseudohalocynthiibacter aestuariivivens]|nr:ABC transporter permease subunit [Pseudohalocynthiibacter aestuariivivens]QIE47778.1 ABC transporter permease subunit [Pseudohalocynthiibacter aestuariivivens]
MNALQDLRFDAVFDVAIESSIEWLNDNFAFFFDTLRTGLDGALFALNWALGFPWPIFIVLTALACWRLSGWGLALFSVISLVLCWQADLWEMLIETLALVLLATLIALAIAIPLGIAGARWSRLGKALEPVMDTLQTLPPYVYLLPAIALIGYGGASAVMATMVLAVPPSVRLTMLGMRHIPVERIELSQSLGARPLPELFKVRIPSAMPSIMAGVNQSLMMALGMAVIAGIIGADGLGGEVYRAIRYLEVGRAMDAGLAIVVISILLDRLSVGAAAAFMSHGGDHGR